MTLQYSGSFSMTLDMLGKTSCFKDRSGTCPVWVAICFFSVGINEKKTCAFNFPNAGCSGTLVQRHADVISWPYHKLWIWFLTIILKWENHGAKLGNLLSNLPRSTWIRFHVWLDFYLLFINWLSFLHVSTYLKNNFFLTFFKLLFQTHLRLNRLLYYKNKDK
jgi:hypothetical protein